jgi:hypothetical protein
MSLLGGDVPALPTRATRGASGAPLEPASLKCLNAKPDVSKVSENAVVIVSAFLAVPLLTLAHELGHAAAALRFTQEGVRIRVGRAHPSARLRVGRLLVAFSPIGAGGRCTSSPAMSRRQALIRVLAGPATNLVLAALFCLGGLFTAGTARTIMFMLTAVSGSQAALNLVPRRGTWNPITRGLPSDGLQALWLIRHQPLPLPPRAGSGMGFWNPDEVRQVALMLGVGAASVLPVVAFGEVALWVMLAIDLQTILAGGSMVGRPKVVRGGRAP